MDESDRTKWMKQLSLQHIDESSSGEKAEGTPRTYPINEICLSELSFFSSEYWWPGTKVNFQIQNHETQSQENVEGIIRRSNRSNECSDYHVRVEITKHCGLSRHLIQQWLHNLEKRPDA